MIFHAFLIKYAEIAIKGKNRYLFEDALVKQMKLALEPVEGEFTVTKEQGRVYVFCPEKYDFDEALPYHLFQSAYHLVPEVSLNINKSYLESLLKVSFPDYAHLRMHLGKHPKSFLRLPHLLPSM